jgi:quercetin dioxygenase-like cupin family protein
MPVSIVRPSDRNLRPVGTPPDEGGGAPSPVQLEVISGGLDGQPYVHVTEVPAGHYIDAHSHSEPEVTIILSGRATVGDTVCEAGSVVVIPADEVYSLEAGDEPLTFVVVRPRKADYHLSE